jgi:hypothetical protein
MSATTIGMLPAIRGLQPIGDINGKYYLGTIMIIYGKDGYEVSFDPVDTDLLADFNQLVATFIFSH